MADPTRYERGYSFAGFQANAPKTPLPGQRVDVELSNLELSIDTVVDAITDIRRSDGRLKNGVVTQEALSPEISTGIAPAVDWTASTRYILGAVVFNGTAFYRSTIEHTSSGSFATDLAAEKWVKFADLSPVADEAAASRDEAVAAADTATTQAGIATGAAGTATTQAGIATTGAATATTQAGVATTQAGIATTKAGEAAASAAAAAATAATVINGFQTRVRYSAADGNLTNGQTVFTVPGGYDPNEAEVQRNGLTLVNGVDVDVTSGATFTLSSGVGASDVVVFKAFGVFNANSKADTPTAIAGTNDTKFVTPLGVTGNVGERLKERAALTPWDFRSLVTGGEVAAGQDDYPAFAALAAQYALGRAVAVPDLGSPYRTSLPLTFLPPADYNFKRRPPPAFKMDPSAVIRATAAMTHVLRFGSDASDYSGYLRGPVLNLGVIDGNNLADICLDLPFFVDGYFNADLRNAKKRYARFGVDTAPANSAGVKGVLQTDRDVEPWRVSVTGITNGSNPTMTISQFSGEPYRAWPVGERRVVSFAALPSGWSSLANKFVDVQIVSSTSVTLLNVDSTSFGTWSGTASAYLNMPWSPPRVISGVTNANPCVITFAAPHLATSGQTYEIHDIGGMPSIDGDYVVTVLSPTTVSVPINTTSTSTWGVYSAGLGKGYAALKEDLDDMLIGLYAENCSDVDDGECFIRGVRVGASHSLSGGYDGKKNQAHVWNLIEQGELLAAYRVGGDNRLGFVQIDGPFRWCFWAINGKNSSVGCSTNYGALAPYDGYACPVRVEAGATWRSFGDNWKSFSGSARLLKDASGPGTYECFGTEYSNMLLPVVQQFSYLPQAMVRFVSKGGSFGTKKASLNVATVTRNSASGDYIVSFNSPVSLDAIVSASVTGNGNFSIQEEISYGFRSLYERRFTVRYLDNTLLDPDEVSIIWYKV